MPIYEYKCQRCGDHFEKRQSVSDEPMKVCEKCGGALEKQWSLSGFQFKGAGWYVTDYSSKGSGNDKKTEKPATSESTDTSTTASKPSSDTTSTSKKE